MELRRAVEAIAQVMFPPPSPRIVSCHTEEPVRTEWCERRRSPRHELEITFSATTHNGAVLRGYTRELNDNGAAALIWGELAIGEEVLLALHLPASLQSAEVPAVVRHRIGFRYGLEFCSPDH